MKQIELDSKYSVYWDSYEVGEEEYNNAIVVEGVGTFNQGEGTNGLWKTSLNSAAYNEARRRITGENYKNMANHKGIGVNEVSNSYSFYGAYNTGSTNTWNWFETVDQATSGSVSYARAWNSDYVLIGHSCAPFVGRGGDVGNSAGAGVLYSDFTNGYSNNVSGFRPVLAF